MWGYQPAFLYSFSTSDTSPLHYPAKESDGIQSLSEMVSKWVQKSWGIQHFGEESETVHCKQIIDTDVSQDITRHRHGRHV